MEWILKLADALIPDWMVGIMHGGEPINTVEEVVEPEITVRYRNYKAGEEKGEIGNLVRKCYNLFTNKEGGRLGNRFKAVSTLIESFLEFYQG